MSIQSKNLRVEYLLYAAFFLLALAARLGYLGSLPLTDAEASLALLAHEAAQGAAPILAPHPAYISLTSALMFLFSSSTWTARFIPALAGSLLVLLPLLFRVHLGRIPALLLAFFLAFDPLLFGISRQVGSLPLALLFTILAVGLWLHGRSIPAGISAGLALLGGPSIWPGFAALLAAIWVSAGSLKPAVDHFGPDSTLLSQRIDWRKAGLAALAAVILVGTLFFTLPNGLSAVAGSFTSRLGGWTQPSGFSAALVLFSLVLYAFFPLIFGLWGALAGLLRKDPLDRFLLVWWAAALLTVLIYPARVTADLAWSMIPLWALAARQLARLLVLPRYDRAPVIGLALFSAVILAFVSLTLVGLFNNTGLAAREAVLRLVGAGLMLAASTLLVGWGWTREIAWRGFVYGLGIVLLLYMVSSGWHTAGLSGQAGREMLAMDSPPNTTDLLVDTIEDLNRWGPRESNGLDIVVLEAYQPSLRWLLRDYRRVSYVDSLPEDASPALVITPLRPELELSAAYRGQSFLYSETIDWNTLRGADWLRWLVFRTVGSQQRVQNRLILWARLDLFPGGLLEQQPELPVIDEQAP